MTLSTNLLQTYGEILRHKQNFSASKNAGETTNSVKTASNKQQEKNAKINDIPIISSRTIASHEVKTCDIISNNDKSEANARSNSVKKK